MIGTLLNAFTVLVGGTLGTFLGHRFPQRMHETIFAALGLFTLFIGMDSALATGNSLIVLGSLLLGALVGEALDIDARLEAFGRWLQRRLSRGSDAASGLNSEGNEQRAAERGERFVEAFVTASIVFCVGPLTIQGAIEDGLMGDYTKLAIKSMLDGFAALAFAATLGPGVLASIVVILGFQGGLALLAQFSTEWFTAPMIAEMTAAGGVVLLSISFRLLDIKEIRSANLLPALFVAPLAVAVMDALGVNYYPL